MKALAEEMLGLRKRCRELEERVGAAERGWERAEVARREAEERAAEREEGGVGRHGRQSRSAGSRSNDIDADVSIGPEGGEWEGESWEEEMLAGHLLRVRGRLLLGLQTRVLDRAGRRAVREWQQESTRARRARGEVERSVVAKQHTRGVLGAALAGWRLGAARQKSRGVSLRAVSVEKGVEETREELKGRARELEGVAQRLKGWEEELRAAQTEGEREKERVREEFRKEKERLAALAEELRREKREGEEAWAKVLLWRREEEEGRRLLEAERQAVADRSVETEVEARGAAAERAEVEEKGARVAEREAAVRRREKEVEAARASTEQAIAAVEERVRGTEELRQRLAERDRTLEAQRAQVQSCDTLRGRAGTLAGREVIGRAVEGER